MKKSLIILFTLTLVVSISNQSSAQAFGGKGSKTFLLGLGFSNFSNIYPDADNHSYLAFNLSIQGEFGIHDYVGLGFTAGSTFSPARGSAWNSSIGIPIGMIGNFHFLQLIADKTDGSFADDMDVYAGLSFGGGPSFVTPNNTWNNQGDVGYTIFGEARVGIRYYFGSKFGIFAEVAQGMSSRLQGGLALKL